MTEYRIKGRRAKFVRCGLPDYQGEYYITDGDRDSLNCDGEWGRIPNWPQDEMFFPTLKAAKEFARVHADNFNATEGFPLNDTRTALIRPDGLGCLDCGEKYGSQRFPDLIIDDDAWKAISPNHDGGGLLCPNCICARLEATGLSNVGSVFRSGPLAKMETRDG